MTVDKYRKRPIEVEATQWFKNGDHPDDNVHLIGEGQVVRYYRNPEINGQMECGQCGHKMHDHGWIDKGPIGHTVCPGDWILTIATGECCSIHPRRFREMYEPVCQDS